jgi:flagellar FliJ protein
MFRFRFESLLNHRRHEEEVAQKMLSEARKDLLGEQSQLKRLKKRRREQIHQLKHLQTGSLAPQEITLTLQYIEQIGGRIEQQREKVRQAQQRVSQRQQVLVGAVKKRKMLEKLKEAEHRRYRHDERKKDLKFMDEVAVNRHIRG